MNQRVSWFKNTPIKVLAKEKSWQQAHRIEERKKEAGYTSNVVSQEDYEDILAKARERMGQMVDG